MSDILWPSQLIVSAELLLILILTIYTTTLATSENTNSDFEKTVTR